MSESFSGRYLREAAKSRRRRHLAGRVLRTAGPALPRKDPPAEPIFMTLSADRRNNAPGALSVIP